MTSSHSSADLADVKNQLVPIALGQLDTGDEKFDVQKIERTEPQKFAPVLLLSHSN
jgi:hypothetical protein